MLSHQYSRWSRHLGLIATLTLFICSDSGLNAHNSSRQSSEEQSDQVRARDGQLSSNDARVRRLIELAEATSDDNGKVLSLTAEALGLIGETTQPDLEARTRICRSGALRSSGQHLEALAEACSAEELARTLDDRILVARALYARSAAEWRNSDSEVARGTATEALELLGKGDSAVDLAKTHTLLGAIHRARGEYESAVRHHLKARHISEGLLDELGIARSDNNLALIYWHLERLEDAHAAMLNALSVYREQKRRSQLLSCLSNLGLILTELDRPAEALPYLEEALAKSSRDEEPHVHAKLLSNIGFAHRQLADETTALDYYGRCLALRRQMDDKHGIVRASGAVAGIYQNKDQHEQAIPMLEKALALAEEIEVRDEQAALLRLLSESREAVGDHAGALTDHKEFHRLQMAVSGPEVQLRVAKLERQYAAERYAAEKRELELIADSRAQALASQAEAQRHLIFASVFLALGFALVAGLLYSRNRALLAARDVNKKLHEATQQLSESESRYRTLFENPDAISLVVDSETEQLIDLNPLARELCGVSDSKHDLRIETIEPAWLREASQQYMRSETDTSLRTEHWDSESENVRWTEVRGSLVHVDGRLTQLLTIRDVTQEYAFEKARLRSDKLESLGLLAGGIAHDFNNALMAIMGYTAIARHRLGEVNCDELAKVEEAANQATGLTRQLLTFASGGAPVRELTRIDELLVSTVELATAGSPIKILIDVADDLAAAELDHGQFAQAVSNLVINASEAANGQGELVVRAVNTDQPPPGLPTDAPGRYVRIDFVDNGPGVPKQIAEQIFDPYFTTKSTGTGLGLATVHTIMQRHGGSITLRSAKPHGAVFSLYFPASAHTVNPSNGSSIDCSSAVTLRILVLEDEPMLRNVYERLLGSHGHSVVTVGDGEAAVSEYVAANESGQPYDLLIMDLTIPGGLGGLETIKRIHEYTPSAVAIVASGYSNAPVMADPQKAGFAGALKKPFGEAALRNAIAAAVEPGTCPKRH